MALIKVTAGELKAQAEKLRALNAQYKSAVDQLEAQATELQGMYEGDSATAFQKAFGSDKIQMRNFYNAIENYAVKLQEIAAKYEATESANVEVINSKSV